MRIILLSTIAILLFSADTLFAQSAFDKMTNEKMNKILLREVEKLDGKKETGR